MIQPLTYDTASRIDVEGHRSLNESSGINLTKPKTLVHYPLLWKIIAARNATVDLVATNLVELLNGDGATTAS